MFPIITLAGTPYERGTQYGRQAVSQIHRSIATYAMLFAYHCGMEWHTVRNQARAYINLLDTQAPDLLDEMRGIASGSGYALEEIVALNARTELLAGNAGRHTEATTALARNRAHDLPPPVDINECTTLAVLPEITARNETLLGQTWDWIGTQRAACVVLRISQADGPDILTLTEGGMLAKIGLNSAGVGVCLNILRSVHDGASPALPVHVLLRRVLQATDFRQVWEMLRQIRTAAASCITVATATHHAASLELNPVGMGIVEPSEGVLVHTNHCLDSTAQASEAPIEPTSSTIPRYNRAITLLAHQRGQITPALLMGTLADTYDAPLCICRTPDATLPPVEQRETVAAAVLDLKARVMHIAPGRPSEVSFQPVTLQPVTAVS